MKNKLPIILALVAALAAAAAGIDDPFAPLKT